MTDRLPIPYAALEQHVIVLGKTGAGKSSALRVMVEELLDLEKPVCIIDPKGDWYGLKASADGRSAGYPVVIFGGDHADVPINKHSGAAVAEIVATGNRPSLIDLGGWMVGERTRFFIDFAAAFFKHSLGRRHLVIDEVHNFAYQAGRMQDPNAAKMLHWANRLASEGRGRGITLLAASQRPQKVHKDFVTSCETLVAMRVIHKLDRNAIRDWIDGCADPFAGAKVIGELAGMKRGEAVAWSPEIEFGPARVTFPLFQTYDSFTRRETGDVDLEGWAEVDLEGVKQQLADVVAEQEANDPATLKRRIRELEQQLQTGADPELVEQLEQRCRDMAGDLRQRDAELASMREAIRSAADSLLRAGEMKVPEWMLVDEELPDSAGGDPIALGVRRAAASFSRVKTPVSRMDKADGGLAKGEHTVLSAIASYPAGVDRDQLFVLTGYKSTSIDTYIKRLRAAGYLEAGWPAVATPEGVAALGPDFEPLPTGPALVGYWRDRLATGELKIFDAVVLAHPGGLSKQELSDITDYRSTSVDTYVKKLRARRLVEKRGRDWYAAEVLF